MNPYLVFLIGIAAQILFSGRLLVQWIASERAKKVLSPTLFWQMSMAASFMLCVYGWLRNDFAIIAGQLISYYIYIWNLRAKKAWDTMPAVLRAVVSYLPVVAVCWFAVDWRETAEHLFRQENIPGWLIVFGTVGQFTFTLRFIYQWRYSARAGESLLPTTFWLISLLGSGMIIAYAIIRRDPVLILGQSTGFVVYLRNIMISRKAARRESAR
ncbi:MAG TPA: lipid-A-disaccharide synthase N-terminal domain-containing protein [Candidatus Merdimorpha stercoravium]|uniref:Lipid-A-disaccharide synthase N-terminal domain-containing protein n=1 Tax=Candidatus Merdimorpha stercoravium TaxID=2840863 RepID=A0A9D1H9J7_9FLAO|nr:lipid-A-disaccharide synthase N-terminal domain-containing protein [Candidatus Merdimorpha stercoravium]